MRRFALCCALFACSAQWPIHSAESSPQFWIAGKYDGSKIIVYFDTVDLKGSPPPQGRKIDLPANGAFLIPEALSSDAVNRLLRDLHSLRIAIGDQFDVWAGAHKFTVTIDTLVGARAGDGDAYRVGALAHVDEPQQPLLADFYVLAQHRGSLASGSARSSPKSGERELQQEALSRPTQALQAQIAAELTRHMRVLATPAVREKASNVSPVLSMRSFRLRDGSVRYYAVAQWVDALDTAIYSLGAWLSVTPSLRLLALEQPQSDDEDVSTLPALLAFFPNLGGNQAAVLIGSGSELGFPIRLLVYRDGVPTKDMSCLAELPVFAD